LKHHRDVALARLLHRDVDAVLQHAPGVRALEAGEDPQRRRLAGAGRAEQREKLAGIDRQVTS
jgi:hypothetical protein